MRSLITCTLVMLGLPRLFRSISVDGLGSAIAASLVLGISNAIIAPILRFLTMPINFLTLGLFSFVISGGMILLTANVVPGFRVDGWPAAILAAIVLSLVNGIFV